MSKKTLTRFNVKDEYIKLLDIESEKRGLSKHDFLNYVLYEYLVKKQDRLANHVAKNIENLVLMLLTSNTTYNTIQEVFNQVIIIDSQKQNLLHEQKYSKKDKKFWNKLLLELHPSEFMKIKTQNDANNKITSLYNIVKEHKEMFQ